ncbi:ribonuclease domain-containing protein [Corynebacterium sp.]|uniref:ribonuclease domain-containing protein n=1 Tax=Corynebacterium sp. TaxID=1720 RepID=UPI0026DAC110|nr:ribonuclease domain-containing protein [Corynebacterium sp.]MDO5031025.1 ribonuclease domain-containing protein [Corynebacterium sp.]
MAPSAASKKSWPALLGGLILVVAGGYFGFGHDGQGQDGQDAATRNGAAGSAETSVAAVSGLESCPLGTLPPEAEETAEDILAGGPYDYPDNDNQRFGNYEGVLPREAKDFYREYTVETPGSQHRGARRIVTGGGTETDPDVWYYTDDHYDSFCEIPDAE